MDWLDEDGYPTPEMMEWIRDYSGDAATFFRELKNGWAHPSSWGFHEENGRDSICRKKVLRFHLSTGGWSGNETTISAMEEHIFLWMFTWKQSARGGHYIFEFRPDQKVIPMERKKA